MPDDDPHTLELHRFPGHLIRRLHQISVAQFAETVAAHKIDLTPVQYAALRAICSNPGIDQASVAGLIAYDRATLGKVIDRLESKGLIDRSISPTDRRARQLEVTEVGLQVLAQVQPLVDAVQGEILTGLNAEEKEQFMRLLQKATDAGNDRSRAPLRSPARER
ncbi:MarR family transcriptional regulator [Phaeobacter sp. QD34_3]|nr:MULTISPECIES: MarR family transcriptional regulator [unclassified Phaeobacter]MDE4133351.1 MarR family transcriptional regulator [Phaeobacter sp. QD34_3]MDE4136862.1 MarR family transcriptional regulator [Phaeobacter sp. QD34_24]MDE4172847.1 MarR family transcriptional regulator [Phaeobacter sp. PT47_59]